MRAESAALNNECGGAYKLRKSRALNEGKNLAIKESLRRPRLNKELDNAMEELNAVRLVQVEKDSEITKLRISKRRQLL